MGRTFFYHATLSTDKIVVFNVSLKINRMILRLLRSLKDETLIAVQMSSKNLNMK